MPAYGQVSRDVQRLEQSFAAVCNAMAELIQAVEAEAREAGLLAPNGLDEWRATLNKAIADVYPNSPRVAAR